MGIDVFKMVTSSDTNYSLDIKKIIGRTIAAVSVFFVPVFVNLLLNLLNKQSYNAGSCWTNANSSTIASFRNLENAEKQLEKERIAEEKRKSEEEAQRVAESAATKINQRIALLTQDPEIQKGRFSAHPDQRDELLSGSPH